MKAFDDLGESQIEVPLDVLAKDPFRIDLFDHPRDLGPEVARIVRTPAFAGCAKRLARITGSDDMNASTPRLAVEGFEIVPDRRRSQGRVFHPCHDSGCRVSFPLDVTYSPISGLGDMQAEIEAGISGTEGDTAKVVRLRAKLGVWIHKAFSHRSLGRRSCSGSKAS